MLARTHAARAGRRHHGAHARDSTLCDHTDGLDTPRGVRLDLTPWGGFGSEGALSHAAPGHPAMEGNHFDP